MVLCWDGPDVIPLYYFFLLLLFLVYYRTVLKNAMVVETVQRERGRSGNGKFWKAGGFGVGVGVGVPHHQRGV